MTAETPETQPTITLTNTKQNTDNEQFTLGAYKPTEDLTIIHMRAPVKVVLDQIIITRASDDEMGRSSYSVKFGYSRTSEYHRWMAGFAVLSPEDGERLVDWLETHGAYYIIEDADRRSTEMEAAEARGACAVCDEPFDDHSDWHITLHHDSGIDQHYCSEDCFEERV